MDKMKQWVALTAVGVLAVLAAGWFLLVSPKRSEATDIQSQAATVETADMALTTQLAVLKSQAKRLPQQQAKLAAVAAKIPDNPALPALIRALDGAAASAGVELISIAPTAPSAFTTATATTAVVGAGATAPPTEGAAGALQAISLNINVVGGYFQVEQFLDGMESVTRALKVTAFTLIPGDNPVTPQPAGSSTAATVDSGKVLSASITGQVFMASARTSGATAAAAKTVGAKATTASAPAN